MCALKRCQMQTPLRSFIVLCLLHGAVHTVGLSKLQIKDVDKDVCPGSTLTFECTVNGKEGGSTVWQGFIFSESDCMIILLHIRFREGAESWCNNEAIIRYSQSMRVENNSMSSNKSLYISQLVVAVQPEMIGKEINIGCSHDNGTNLTEVGHISLIATMCNASQYVNDTGEGHTTVISKEARLPVVVISSSVIFVLLFMVVLLVTLIFLLYGRHKKLWSTLNSVCNIGTTKGTSQDCHVVNNKVDDYMEVVKIVDNEKMGIYNKRSSNYEVQKAKNNNIINAEQGEISICNLNNLVHALQGQVSSKWYSFGLAIGVPKKILNQLNHYHDEECLVEVLDYWLRHHPGNPTWQEVIEAKDTIAL